MKSNNTAAVESELASALHLAVCVLKSGSADEREDALRLVGDCAIDLEEDDDESERVKHLVDLIGHAVAALAVLTGSVDALGCAGELATLRSEVDQKSW